VYILKKKGFIKSIGRKTIIQLLVSILSSTNLYESLFRDIFEARELERQEDGQTDRSLRNSRKCRISVLCSLDHFSHHFVIVYFVRAELLGSPKSGWRIKRH
jgi:hypothetical protein